MSYANIREHMSLAKIYASFPDCHQSCYRENIYDIGIDTKICNGIVWIFSEKMLNDDCSL